MMAQAIVNFIVQSLGDLLIQEAVFLYGVEDQVLLLQTELRLMRSYLQDADRRQDENESLRSWISEIREAAYDSDDVIESYAFREASRRNLPGLSNLITRYASIINRFIEIHMVGSHVKNVIARISSLTRSLKTYGIQQGEASNSMYERQTLRRSYSHVIEEDIIGVDDDVKILESCLVDPSKRYRVIAICGMGGLGKTTLAKKVYHSVDVRNKFESLAWAYISQHCQARDVWIGILFRLISPSQEQRQEIENMRDEELARMLYQVQVEKCCLVVLDDIWNADTWNKLKPAFPQGLSEVGSKILLTSRNIDVAFQMDPSCYLHTPKCLNEVDSWELFQKKAFPKIVDPDYREKEKLGREMVGRCGGLPLAIIVLGGLLASKPTFYEWDIVYKNINTYLRKANGQEQRLGEVLALSYYELPYQLKPCFLHLAHFPENLEIPTKKLIRIWVAEGIISLAHNEGEGEEALEDVAQRYLTELVERCMIQVVEKSSSGRIRTCQWQRANTLHEKIIFGAWLKYEKQEEELIADLLANCGKCAKEFAPVDIASHLPFDVNVSSVGRMTKENRISQNVTFKIGDEEIVCDRQKISELSAPFHAMLKGYFSESRAESIDLSENNISPLGMKAISNFSLTDSLIEVPPNLLLEILVFANKYCCERLKDACDRRLASLVSSKEDAVELMEYALDENSTVLAASCLQVLLRDLRNCLNDSRVVEIFVHANKQQLAVMVGPGIFALFCFLSEVSMNLNSSSDKTAHILERLVEFAENDKQRLLALHQLGCVRLLRKEYDEARLLFEGAVKAGHIYSVAGLARLEFIKGDKLLSYEQFSSVISSVTPLGWMYQERSLYCDSDKRWDDLEKASNLDPTLAYPYMYRAASLMRTQNAQAALAEINRILGFKLSLECLEIRFFIHLTLEDYKAALCDVQTILTLRSDYRMFEGRVAASQLCTLVREHVERWTTADCWARLYDCWSAVDDIGSLSVIYQMLESDAAKGILYFRQSLLLLRLNCPEAAMRSLQLARQHASSEHERLVYEGWILYDTGHYEEGLRKAEESISIKRSFEAFFLKAYALADSSIDPSCSPIVISLLEDALKCPSDNLRKGQALNNLGSVYVDCGKLDLAADCYINALKIRHTRAHHGLARVHCLKNDKTAAYMEMTELIKKAKNNASAYEKRSEYCDREQAKTDLEMVTRLDPLRVYPYRYRAAVLMDNHKEEEAIAELSRAIAFKADLHLLHLRAAFHEHKEDVLGALRDCRAALSVDPNHQEMLELHSRVNRHEP